jgi:hypothetical protein
MFRTGTMCIAASARIRRALLGAALCGAGMAFAPGAWAAEDSAQSVAREHNRRGETQYAAGHYAEALVEYQAGFDTVPLPGFLINMAQCYRRLGDLPRARVTYEKFVLVAPDSPLIGEVRGQIAEIDKDSRSGSEPSAANKPKGTSTPADPHPFASVSSKTPAAPGMAAISPTPFLPQPSPPAVDAQSPGTDLTGVSVNSAPPENTIASQRPNHHRWWLWGSITAAAVVSGAIATYVALSNPDGTVLHEGTLGSLRR